MQMALLFWLFRAFSRLMTSLNHLQQTCVLGHWYNSVATAGTGAMQMALLFWLFRAFTEPPDDFTESSPTNLRFRALL